MKTGALGGNLHRHKENIQTCEVAVLIAAPLCMFILTSLNYQNIKVTKMSGMSFECTSAIKEYVQITISI